jgi:hypothetical protein
MAERPPLCNMSIYRHIGAASSGMAGRPPLHARRCIWHLETCDISRMWLGAGADVVYARAWGLARRWCPRASSMAISSEAMTASSRVPE